MWQGHQYPVAWVNCCLLPSRARAAQETPSWWALWAWGAEPRRAWVGAAQVRSTPAPVSDPVGGGSPPPRPGMEGAGPPGKASQGRQSPGRGGEREAQQGSEQRAEWKRGPERRRAGFCSLVPGRTVGSARGREGVTGGRKKGDGVRPSEEQRQAGLAAQLRTPGSHPLPSPGPRAPVDPAPDPALAGLLTTRASRGDGSQVFPQQRKY